MLKPAVRQPLDGIVLRRHRVAHLLTSEGEIAEAGRDLVEKLTGQSSYLLRVLALPLVAPEPGDHDHRRHFIVGSNPSGFVEGDSSSKSSDSAVTRTPSTTMAGSGLALTPRLRMRSWFT